jgi:diguanylate cyclase (GGDEF)-like protein/PAS domain S-box-containing protein
MSAAQLEAGDGPFIRAILQDLPVAVFWIDRGGCVLGWNTEAEQLSGIPEAELVGRPVHPGPLRLDGRRTDLGTEGSSWRDRVILRRKDGRERVVDLRVVPTLDASGAVIGAVGIFLDTGPVAALATAHARLRDLACTDPLTGVANRRAIDEALSRHASALESGGPAYCVLLADLDRFKRINDAGGHPAGDQALRRVAEVLRAGCRAQDTVGRLGGDEFVIVAPATDLDAAQQIAQRLQRSLGSTAAGVVPGGEAITASFGVARARPGEPAEVLLARADAALYRAKARGRDRVETEPDSADPPATSPATP